MFTEEQILELYFKRDEHAVEMTSQMYGAKLTRFADSMVAHWSNKALHVFLLI